MYKGFNLKKLSFTGSLENLAEKGRTVCSETSASIRDSLKSFLSGDVLDGSKLQEHWFPKTDANVFISHSHADEELAFALAGWLSKTFQLTSFIDSAVWGYSDELLKNIDNQYCLNPGGETYSYEKRNGSTGHVHMMLSTALGQMIDSTECLIFLNTPQSITTKEAMEKTHSPWLLAEVVMATTMRREIPKRLQKTAQFQENLSANGGMEKVASLKVDYKVDLSPFTTITNDTLIQWQKERGKVTHALDDLYQITEPQPNLPRPIHG